MSNGDGPHGRSGPTSAANLSGAGPTRAANLSGAGPQAANLSGAGPQARTGPAAEGPTGSVQEDQAQVGLLQAQAVDEVTAVSQQLYDTLMGCVQQAVADVSHCSTVCQECAREALNEAMSLYGSAEGSAESSLLALLGMAQQQVECLPGVDPVTGEEIAGNCVALPPPPGWPQQPPAAFPFEPGPLQPLGLEPIPGGGGFLPGGPVLPYNMPPFTLPYSGRPGGPGGPGGGPGGGGQPPPYTMPGTGPGGGYVLPYPPPGAGPGAGPGGGGQPPPFTLPYGGGPFSPPPGGGGQPPPATMPLTPPPPPGGPPPYTMPGPGPGGGGAVPPPFGSVPPPPFTMQPPPPPPGGGGQPPPPFTMPLSPPPGPGGQPPPWTLPYNPYTGRPGGPLQPPPPPFTMPLQPPPGTGPGPPPPPTTIPTGPPTPPWGPIQIEWAGLCAELKDCLCQVLRECLVAPSATAYAGGGQQFVTVEGLGQDQRPVEQSQTQDVTVSGPVIDVNVSRERMAEGAQGVERHSRAFFAALSLHGVRFDPCADTAGLNEAAADLVKQFWTSLTGTPDGSGISADGWLGQALGVLPSWLRGMGVFFIGLYLQTLKAPVEVAQAITGCDGQGILLTWILRAGLDIIERWVGASFPEAQERLRQASGQICAVRFPDPGDATMAYNSAYISEELWRCYVRAAGYDDKRLEPIRNAASGRPNADQTMEYCLRTNAPESTVEQLMHGAGVRDALHWQMFRKLAEFGPGPSDLVTFMTRDVFDEKVVAKYQYDEGFREKFSGKAEEWARWQGMTAEQFKYFWRAHWQLPSPTQGYEMIHRLRPGVTDPQLVTTQEDIRGLLEVADYPAYWRDRLIAISYHPLTRTDAQRAYFIGALDRDGVLSALKDLGYEDANAAILLRFWTLLKQDWLMRRPMAREYVQGYVREKDARYELVQGGLTDEEADDVLRRLNDQLTRRMNKPIIAALRQRVLRGLLASEEAVAMLLEMGFTATQAARYQLIWDQERKARGKHATVAMLCDWYGKAWVSAEEYGAALGRIGYGPDQVALIMRACEDKGGKARAKAEAAAKRAEETQEARETTDQQKKASRANLLKAQAVRKARAASKSEERVQRNMGQAALLLAREVGGDPSIYADLVKALLTDLVAAKHYDRESAAAMIRSTIIPIALTKKDGWLEAMESYVASLPVLPAEVLDAPDVETK